MKPSSTTQTVLVISSWTGNLILTGLAFALAFRSPDPLTPLTFLTLAICIILGNALPLTVHLVNFWWAQALLKAEQAEAQLSLRSAVARLESAENRLQAAHDSSAKAVLIARQIPERLNEKTQQLLESFEALDTESLAGLQDRLSEHGKSLGEHLNYSRELEDRLRRWIEETGEMGSRMDQEFKAGQDHLKKLLTSLEKNLRERLNDFSATCSQLLAERSERSDLSDPSNLSDLSAPSDADPPDLSNPSDLSDLSDSAPSDSSDPSDKSAPSDPWEDLLAAGSADIQEIESGKVVIIARCMVGIRNRLYARGEGGGLSWDEGRAFELTGIGEYRLELNSVAEPVTFKLLLNDQQSAKGENMTLRPGQSLRIQPKF